MIDVEFNRFSLLGPEQVPSDWEKTMNLTKNWEIHLDYLANRHC